MVRIKICQGLADPSPDGAVDIDLLERKTMLYTSQDAMLDILGIELQLHVLSCYCLPA